MGGRKKGLFGMHVHVDACLLRWTDVEEVCINEVMEEMGGDGSDAAQKLANGCSTRWCFRIAL